MLPLTVKVPVQRMMVPLGTVSVTAGSTVKLPNSKSPEGIRLKMSVEAVATTSPCEALPYGLLKRVGPGGLVPHEVAARVPIIAAVRRSHCAGNVRVPKCVVTITSESQCRRGLATNMLPDVEWPCNVWKRRHSQNSLIAVALAGRT